MAMRLLVGVMLAAATQMVSGEPPRILSEVMPGTSVRVVVAEGDNEPRSVGSYSLRVYAGRNPSLPYDDYIAGMIRRRNGAIERLEFPDLDGDGSPEIVVVIRAAGTGGYLSADAFRLRGAVLGLIGSVAGLSSNVDPVRVLESRMASRSIMRGRLYWGHEVRSFKPCGSNKTYWVRGEENMLQSLRERADSLREKRGPDQPLYMEAVGRVDTVSARDGFATKHDGLLFLRTIVRLSDDVPRQCANVGGAKGLRTAALN